MVSADREPASRLVALTEDSEILGYTQAADPRRFLRELRGSRPRSSGSDL
jgi:hypothetical protein